MKMNDSQPRPNPPAEASPDPPEFHPPEFHPPECSKPEFDVERFVATLTENQPRVYAYVYSLVSDHGRAADVVQETNVVLWRKRAQYDARRPFLPWAFAVARFQVLASLRDSTRDRMVLDSELVEQISEQAAAEVQRLDCFAERLQPCLNELDQRSRELITHRYRLERPIAEIAQSTGRTQNAIKTALMRVRRRLASCLERRESLATNKRRSHGDREP